MKKKKHPQTFVRVDYRCKTERFYVYLPNNISFNCNDETYVDEKTWQSYFNNHYIYRTKRLYKLPQDKDLYEIYKHGIK